MEITCPKCNFTKLFPVGKIPATAEVATCPRCKHRFKFRSLDDDASPEPVFDEPAPPVDAVPDLQHDSPLDSPLDSTETAPEAEQAGTDEPHTDSAPASTDDDIWESLEHIGTPDSAPQPLEDNTSPPRHEERTEHEKHAEHEKRTEHEAPQRPRAIRQTTDVPWERLDKFGFFDGLMLTVKRVLFSPVDFFSSMAPKAGFKKPLVFYVLISMVSMLFRYMWIMLGMEEISPMGQESVAAEEIDTVALPMLILFVYPVLFAFVSFLSAGFNHLFLMLFQAASSEFEGTYRATTYAHAPFILTIAPVVGVWVALIWMIITSIIAFKCVHRTSYARVIAAVFAPIVIVLLIGTISATMIPSITQ